MRPPRNSKTNHRYHLIRRIAHRTLFLDEEERASFADRLWRVAQFSCVEVLAYCSMSNHFHSLVYVPERFDLSDDEPFVRIRALRLGVKLGMIQKECDAIVKTRGARAKADSRKKFLRRMWNVSEFVPGRESVAAAQDVLVDAKGTKVREVNPTTLTLAQVLGTFKAHYRR